MAFSYRSPELGELWGWFRLGRVLWFSSRVRAAVLKISAAGTIRPLWNHVDNNRDGNLDNQANRGKGSGAGKRGASHAFPRTQP